jgi:hypothetical protein
MILPFTDALIVTNKFDPEMAALADRHYSRRTPGDRQFLPPGRTICIRDSQARILFGWNWQLPEKRADKQDGYYCSIFRNEGQRRSSEVILECEAIARDRCGIGRMFTYIAASKVRSINPGYCFKCAGWKREGYSLEGLHLLVKAA